MIKFKQSSTDPLKALDKSFNLLYTCTSDRSIFIPSLLSQTILTKNAFYRRDNKSTPFGRMRLLSPLQLAL